MTVMGKRRRFNEGGEGTEIAFVPDPRTSLFRRESPQNQPSEADPEPYVPVREFLAFVGECVVLLFREIRSLK